jgi:hypothetical protein
MLMSGGSANTTFQIDEQRRLVELWDHAAVGGRLPSRRDIAPSRMVALLPHVSIVDTDGHQPGRVRLAGTGLRNLYGREITGLAVADMPFGSAADYWVQTFRDAIRMRRPVWGAAPATGRQDPRIATQIWTRLPLSSDGHTVDAVIALDCVRWTAHLPAALRDTIDRNRTPEMAAVCVAA